jgi:hypothetical protein
MVAVAVVADLSFVRIGRILVRRVVHCREPSVFPSVSQSVHCLGPLAKDVPLQCAACNNTSAKSGSHTCLTGSSLSTFMATRGSVEQAGQNDPSAPAASTD